MEHIQMMRRVLGPLGHAAVIALLVPPALSAAPEGSEVVLYVSPSGHDGNGGSREEPFATLERARDAVRSIRSGPGGREKDVTVRLRGGLYILARPFVLGVDDGGTPGHAVTYSAEEGESPVLSGGMLIRGWKETELNGRRVWKAVLPPGGAEGAGIHELWVNGLRMLQSRYPRKGYLGVEYVPGVTAKTGWLGGETAFCAAGRDLPSGE